MQLDTKDAAEWQRGIVDAAYRIDAELARSVASLADDDPARKAARRNVQERLRLLQAREEMRDGKIADGRLSSKARSPTE
jgi:hypothetical protein